MKRGQILSQPFQFIFIMLIIVVTLAFGSYLIYKLLDFGQDVSTVKFKNDLDLKVRNIASETPGSNEKVSFLAPENLIGVCFLDGTVRPDRSKIPFQSFFEELSIIVPTTDDVFLIDKEGQILERFNIDKLRVGDTICFEFLTNNKIEFILESTGRDVLMKKVL